MTRAFLGTLFACETREMTPKENEFFLGAQEVIFSCRSRV
jgi:hypothetical protein